MEIDPSYENLLGGREAWTLRDVAWVAAGLSLRTRSGHVVKDARDVWTLLTKAVKSKALATVECPVPTVVPEAVRYPRPSRRAAFGMAAGMFDSVQVVAPTVTPSRVEDHSAEATVRPADAVAWLRDAGKPAMAARVERVAEALCPKPAAASSFEAIEAGDEPRNLSKASPHDLAAWIAAYWERVWSKPKGAGEALKKILQAGGFTKGQARAIHEQHKPDWFRPGQSKAKP